MKSVTHYKHDSSVKFNLHLLLSSILDLRCEAKVGDLHLHGVVDEHVAELEVAMYHVLAVDVLASTDQLAHEVPHFGLRQRLPRLQHVHQRLKQHRQHPLISSYSC